MRKENSFEPHALGEPGARWTMRTGCMRSSAQRILPVKQAELLVGLRQCIP